MEPHYIRSLDPASQSAPLSCSLVVVLSNQQLAALCCCWCSGLRQDTDRRCGLSRTQLVSSQFRFLTVGSCHVGEHGGTEAPGDDQPVCFDGRLRCRSGQAASPGGPLAVRDGSELLLPGGQHSQSPPDDVYPQKHSGHAAQLPRRHHHVLQAAGVGVRPRSHRPPPGVRGLLPSGLLFLLRLLLLLGLVSSQPPAGLAAPVLPQGSPHAPPLPPPSTGSNVAPCLPTQQFPAASRHVSTPQPEMRPAGRAGPGDWDEGGQGVLLNNPDMDSAEWKMSSSNLCNMWPGCEDSDRPLDSEPKRNQNPTEHSLRIRAMWSVAFLLKL
ncbi:hypothetical protein AMECASPLE_006123 [Ameca splendens]|uniref:Uncharacterized protein n=1 Tax=Ameca splendens TaxID=208324 RepID=A0ABV0YXA6_9TELE